jgi:hypothetical protein
MKRYYFQHLYPRITKCLNQKIALGLQAYSIVNWRSLFVILPLVLDRASVFFVEYLVKVSKTKFWKISSIFSIHSQIQLLVGH